MRNTKPVNNPMFKECATAFLKELKISKKDPRYEHAYTECYGLIKAVFNEGVDMGWYAAKTPNRNFASAQEKDMTKLEQLKDELKTLKWAIYCKEMSDNYCYSNRSIYPLLNEEKELKAKIVELETKEVI